YCLAKSLLGLGNHLGNLGRSEEECAEYRRAATILEKLMTEYPGEPRYGWPLADIVNRTGVHFAQEGRYADAEAAYRRAIKLSSERKSDDGLYYANLGAVLSAQNRHTEAEAALREAVGLRPYWADGYCSLGHVLWKLGRPAEAEAALRRAIE